MSFLLDTNVVSELRRVNVNENVRAWFETVPSRSLYLSVLVVGEVRQGVERLSRKDAVQAARIERWLEALKMDYSDRILPISVAVAEVWGRLNAVRPLPVVDGLLAATAEVHGLTLVTRNTADVARTGVKLFNPFGGH